jgi:hypothetical protein
MTVDGHAIWSSLIVIIDDTMPTYLKRREKKNPQDEIEPNDECVYDTT